MEKKPTPIGSGKGGNFATRKNPFTENKAAGNRPQLADCNTIGLALDQILNCECAVIIGTTRDGGALVVTILDNDERHRTYCSNDAELDDAIAAIHRLYVK